MVSQNNAQQNSRRGGDSNNQRLTSNERGPGMMSPFEKKIASYQKSAERRKQGAAGDRSGSRSRPTQQVNLGQTSGDPYGVGNNEGGNDTQELKFIRSRIRQLDNIFEDFTGKLLVKSQDAKDMDRQVDSLFTEIYKHSHTLELILNNSTSQNTSSIQARNRSKNAKDPNISGSHLHQAQSPNFKDPHQEKKLNDLVKSNDQLYMELRKTNERYLNQRVENAKLKDEIQILQAQLEQSLQSSSKLANLSRDGAQSPITGDRSGGRQQIKLKSRPNRHEGSSSIGPNTSGTNLQAAQRTTSNTSNIVSRENEDLKKRIRELEKECFQLTYYQQELQRRGGSDIASRENQEMRNKIEQLCLQVSQFLLAMRRLQRAVNNKDKDIQDLKAEFERNKKSLEMMVKEIKEDQAARRSSAVNHNSSINSGGGQNSLMGSTDKRDQRFQSIEGRHPQQQAVTRNKSQGPHGTSSSYQNTPTQSIQANQTSITQRNEAVDHSSHSLLPPKKGTIRPKQSQPQQTQLQSQQPLLDTTEPHFNLSNPDFTQMTNPLIGQTTLHISQEQEQFNNLLEEIKQISEESERLRRQIHDLQQDNSRLKTEHAAQEKRLQQSNNRAQQCERLINDYKDALEALESQVTEVDISQLRQDLLDQEGQIAQYSARQPNTFGRANHGVQTDLQGDFASLLKHQVAQLIAGKEEEIETQMRGIYQRIEEKEEDVANLKKLFVEKLRELESSFIELSQDMIETEVVQHEAISLHSKKNQKALQSQQQTEQQRLQLERSLEQAIVGQHNDSHDSQLEQLATLNDQLTDENRELREHIKQLEKELEQGAARELDTIRSQFEEMHEANEAMTIELQNVRCERESDRVALEQQKRLFEKLKSETSEDLKSKDKVIDQQLQNLKDYELKLQSLSSQYRESQEIRVVQENEIEKHRQSSQEAESNLQSLKSTISALESQVSSLQQELALINSLKSGSDIAPLDNQNDEARIDSDPISAAHHFLKLMRTVQKEYKILQVAHDKLQFTYDELRAKCDDLKLEARESAQEVMNMETEINDLKEANERLVRDLEQARGEQQSSEAEIMAAKKQVEEEYKAKLAYKETEIEGVNNKLGRLSQSNIDLKTRSERLEQANADLTADLEQCRTRISTLEMQLEFTKENAEQDYEKQLEQVRAQFTDQLEELKSEAARVTLAAHSADSQLTSLSTDLQAIQAKLQRKRGKLVDLRQDLQTKTEELETLKQSIDYHISERNALEARLEDEERSLKGEREQNRRLEEKVEKIEAERKAAQEALEETEKQLGEKGRENERIVGEMAEQKLLVEELEQKTQEQRSEMKEAIQSKEGEIQALKEQLAQSQQNQRELVESLTQQQDAQTQELLSQKDSEIAKLSEDLEEAISRLDSLDKDLRTLREEHQKTTLDLSESHSKFVTTECLLQESQAMLEHTQKVLERTKSEAEESEASRNSQIEEMRKEMTLARDEARDAQDKVDQLEQQLEELNNQISSLQSEIETLQASSSLEQETLKSDLKAQLQAAHEDYEQEISTLKQNHALEIETLKKLHEASFEDLKQKNVDSVNSLTQQFMAQLSSNQEDHSRELDKQAKEHREELESLTSEHQSEVGQLKESIEALKGQLEESQQQQRDLVQSLTDQQDAQTQELLAQKDVEIERLTEDLKTAQARASDLMRNLETLNQETEALNAELQHTRDETEALKRRNEEANEEKRCAMAEIDDKMGRIRELEKVIEDVNGENATLKENYSDLTDQLIALKQENEQSQLTLTAEKDTLQAKLSSLTSDLSTELENSAQVKSNLEQALSSLTLKDEELQALKDQVTQLNDQLTQAQENHDELTQKIQEQEELLQDKDEIIQKHKDHITKLNGEVKDLKQVHDIDMETLRNELTAAHDNEIKLVNQGHMEEIEKLDQQYQKEIGDLKERIRDLEAIQSEQVEKLAALESIEGECQIIREENGDYASKVGELEQQNDNLQARIKELIAELEETRRTQSESENEQIKSLSSKLNALEAQRDEAITKTTEMERTSTELQTILKSKEREMDAQGRDLEQAYLEMSEKEREWAEEKEKLLKIIEDMKEEVVNETDRIRVEREEIEQNARQQVSEMASAIEALELQLNNLTEQLIEIKKEQTAVQEAKKLTESLIEGHEEEIGEIGTENIQYCKRVKYLEKVWILLSKGVSQYAWIEQDRIPLEQLKSINVQEDASQKQEAFQRKLEELMREKDRLAKAQAAYLGVPGQVTTPRSQYSSDNGAQISEYQQLKSLEIENAQLRQDVADLRKLNNNLQQSIVQSKAKISELGEVIIRLTESDGGQNDALTMMATQKQDFKKKYLEQVEMNNKLEQENEALRKQVIELTDLSFAKGFQSQGALGSARGDKFDVLNASSIMGEDEHIDIALANDTERYALQEKVATLEDEVQKYKNQIENLQSENQDLKTNNSQDVSKKQEDDEELENYRHVKNLFIQFLEATPISASKKEDLLPVIFSMLQVSKDEMNRIKKSRENLGLTQGQVKEAAKKGVFGMFKK